MSVTRTIQFELGTNIIATVEVVTQDQSFNVLEAVNSIVISGSGDCHTHWQDQVFELNEHRIYYFYEVLRKYHGVIVFPSGITYINTIAPFESGDGVTGLSIMGACRIEPTGFWNISVLRLGSGCHIMAKAFSGYQNLTYVDLSDCTIEPWAFAYCDNLTELKFNANSVIVPDPTEMDNHGYQFNAIGRDPIYTTIDGLNYVSSYNFLMDNRIPQSVNYRYTLKCTDRQGTDLVSIPLKQNGTGAFKGIIGNKTYSIDMTTDVVTDYSGLFAAWKNNIMQLKETT